MLTVQLTKIHRPSANAYKPQRISIPNDPPPTEGFAIEWRQDVYVDCPTANSFINPQNTKEMIHGKAVASKRRFDKYKSLHEFVEDSYKDHRRVIESIKTATAYYIDGESIPFHTLSRLIEKESAKLCVESLDILGLNDVIDVYGITLENSIINIERPRGLEDFENHFEKAVKRPDDYYMTTLWHGTGCSSVKKIICKGMKASKSGAVGPGVYLGLFAKASEFASMNRFTRTGKRRCSSARSIHYSMRDQLGRARFVCECDVIFKNLRSTGVNWEHTIAAGLKGSGREHEVAKRRIEDDKIRRFDLKIEEDVTLPPWQRQAHRNEQMRRFAMQHESDVLYTLFNNPEYIVRDQTRVLVRRIHIIH